MAGRIRRGRTRRVLVALVLAFVLVAGLAAAVLFAVTELIGSNVERVPDAFTISKVGDR